MKRYRQLIVGSRNDRPRGDCARACIASVLERDPTEVPHFVDLGTELGFHWLSLANGWLRQQGYPFELLQRCYLAPGAKPIRYWPLRSGRQWDKVGFELPGYWIASVRSKLFPGNNHAIVMHDDRVAWDPSPSFGDPTYDRRPYVFEGWAETFHCADPTRVCRPVPS